MFFYVRFFLFLVSLYAIDVTLKDKEDSDEGSQNNGNNVKELLQV